MSITNASVSLKKDLFPAWAPSLGDNKCSQPLLDSEAQRKALGKIRHQMSPVLIISPPLSPTESLQREAWDWDSWGLVGKVRLGNVKTKISNRLRKSFHNANVVF